MWLQQKHRTWLSVPFSVVRLKQIKFKSFLGAIEAYLRGLQSQSEKEHCIVLSQGVEGFEISTVSLRGGYWNFA